MMNKFKILLLLLTISSSTSVFAINPVVSPTFETSCNWANVNERFYMPIWQSTMNIYPQDLIQTPGLSFISNWDSQVNIWSRENWITSSNCSNISWWTPPLGWRVSSVSPWNSTWVLAFANNDCTISIPTTINPATPIAQFVYKVWYKTSLWLLSWDTSIGYFYHEPIWLWVWSRTLIPDQTNRIWSDVSIHPNECWNVYLSYCWDWVQDSTQWEQCDLWAQNWVPGSWCSATCTTASIAPTCQNLTINWWVTPVTVTAGSTVNFEWTGTNLGSSPEYILTITNTTSNTVEATLTWTTGNFVYTFNNTANYSATLTIRISPTEIIWWTNWCLRSLWVWWGWGWGWGGWGGWGGWVWWGWGGWSSNRCWDWIVQRPNSNGQYEECDINAPWCINCTIATTITNPWVRPWNITITNPWITWWYFDISNYKVIVGDSTPIFGLFDNIEFTSSENIYLSWKTVGINNNYPGIISWVSKSYTLGNVWLWSIQFLDHHVYDWSGNIIDSVYITVNYPSSITLFTWWVLQDFKWRTSWLWTSPYKDARTDYTYPSQWTDNFYVNVQFFEEALWVRVSKNMVAGIAWGNAFVYNPVWFDANYIAGTFISSLANGNFVNASTNTSNVVWQNLSSLISDAKVVWNDETNDVIENKNTSEKSSLISFDTSLLLPSTWVTSEIDNMYQLTLLDKLWDNENILVKKSWDIHINASAWPLNLDWVKTVVIENWDLIIDRDIEYIWTDSSWAFIIKNGNLLINKDVTKISWAYLVLNWIIDSSNWSTSNQLIVDWSLMWNSGNLSMNRTYVRWTLNSSVLTTWIIINYSNRVFRNPPPMLTYFINQYNQNKVSK